MRRLFTRAILTLALGLALLAPLSVSALDPLSAACKGAGSDSSACKNPSSDNPVTALLLNISNIVAFVAGIAAIIFLILSGLKYVTSQGDPGEVSKAKQSIIYAIVGLVLIFLGRTVINFVISKV